MKNSNLITLLLILFTSISVQAQYGWRDGNRIGIVGGVNMTNVFTDVVDAKSELGWTAGLQVRGNMYNDWSGVYGIRFIESNFSVNTRSLLGRQEEVTYKMQAAQLHFLFSYNVVENVMSLDFGPVLQINSDLKFKNGFQKNRIQNSDLVIEDLRKISPFNGLVYFGTTIGSKVVRLNVNYTVGVNNLFSRLNNQENLVGKNNGNDFVGRTGVLTGALLINL